MKKRRNCSWGAISPLFHNIFNISLSSGVKIAYSFVKRDYLIYFFLNTANLICRGTDISKYFRESLRLRDNESRLYNQKWNKVIHLAVTSRVSVLVPIYSSKASLLLMSFYTKRSLAVSNFFCQCLDVVLLQLNIVVSKKLFGLPVETVFQLPFPAS